MVRYLQLFCIMKSSLNSLMDNIVVSAHNIKFMEKRLHPYFLFLDLSIIMSILFSGVFSMVFGGINGFKIGAIVALQFLSYEYYLQLKGKIFGNRSRTFFQDTLLYLFPTFILGVLLFKEPILPALDYMAFELVIIISVARIGCFLGGCCHGIPSNFGVKYPKTILKKVLKPRKYTPTPHADIRVFPLPLIEIIVSVTIFSILFIRLLYVKELNGQSMILFIALYCPYRIFSEFYKLDRATKNIGKISQAQIASILLCVVASVCYYLM